MRYALTIPLVAALIPVLTEAQQPQGKPAAPAAPAGARQGGAVVPQWAAIEKVTRSTWAERYPNETIVSIERRGEPEFADEPGNVQMTTSTSYSSVWDWSWSSTQNTTITKGREGAYLRQMIVVTADRANKTRARFHIGALYKLVGGQWTFAEMPVQKVEEVAGADAPTQPTDAEAGELFAAAWNRARPDFRTSSVSVKGKEFKQYRGRFWVTYKLAIEVTGTDKAPAAFAGKAATCEPDAFSSVLNWDATAKAWIPDEKMIANVNETGYCTVK